MLLQKSTTRFRDKRQEYLNWAVFDTTELLALFHGHLKCGTWGWKTHGELASDRHHLLVDIPTGQVCYRLGDRGLGFDYTGDYKPGNTQILIFKWIEKLFNPAGVSIEWTGARQIEMGD